VASLLPAGQFVASKHCVQAENKQTLGFPDNLIEFDKKNVIGVPEGAQ